MTSHVLALVGANALMLALGAGLLPLLQLAGTTRELLVRLPLGYLVGLAATGILAAELAVVGVAAGVLVLSLAAAASLTAGVLRVRRARGGPRSSRQWVDVAAIAILVPALVLLVRAVPLFTHKPLLESDGWMIWGLRARALYDFGHPVAPVFTSLTYPALQHPLWLPALESLDFRFMGAFDGTAVHLQLLAFAVAFVGGAWTLLRPYVDPILLSATLLAIVSAPAFFSQLQTNFADMPLAMLIALGVASLALWLSTGGRGLLPAAVLFLGAAAITKNEGETFALAAYVAALVVAQRHQLRSLAVAALATLAIDLPWRLWLQVHHVRIAEYSLSNLFDPSYLGRQSSRLGPSARELAAQILHVGSWSYLVLLGLLGLAGALVARRFRPAAFAVVWLALSYAGLLAVYWISINPLANHLHFSSNRTIDALVVGAALLAPVLMRPERR